MGLDLELYGLIGGGGSPLPTMFVAAQILQAIRPCRESQRGWTLGAARCPGNHSSLVLNEHGPALKVFWIPECRDWAPDQCPRGLSRSSGVAKTLVPKRTEPEGAGTRSDPARSFRFAI